MATVQIPREQRIVLSHIDWQAYRKIADALGDRHVRLTYDRGNLELVTLSHGHERCRSLFGQIIVVLTEELRMPRQSGGSTTFRHEDQNRGLEADKCYYLESEPLVRDKDEIDLTIDPPPDLAIEIDISRSSLDRMAIYAAIRVPKVWCFDGTTLRVYRLQANGDYRESDRSLHFPMLSLAEVAKVVQRRTQMDEMNLMLPFRQWGREQIALGWPTPPKARRRKRRPGHQ